MLNKLTELRQEKTSLKSEDEERLNELIDQKENCINQTIKEKRKFYEEVRLRDQYLKFEVQNFQTNEDEEKPLINNFYRRNVPLIHLSYEEKVQAMKNQFSQVNFVFR